MGGYVGERIGTKDAAEGAQRRAQSYYHEKIAKPADEAGLHAGQQTGLVMEGVHHGMGQIADTITRSDLNIANWGKRDSKDQGAQSAVGRYSSGRGESSKSSRRGASIEDKAKKKVKGKASLYARK